MRREYDIGHLLGHAEWLRRLAVPLVGDESDDLLQDTWMAAMRAPPTGEATAARSWLAQVLRNFARRRWRSDGARQARERTLETFGEAAPSPEDLLGRAELQRTLADLVLALDEPYRTAVLLRYYEGKSGAEIAQLLGVPAGTVRWRLKEGLDRLRRRLDALHGGDRQRWRAVLAPLALTGPGIGKGLIMAMTGKSKLMVGGAVLALLAVFGIWFVVRGFEGAGRRLARGSRAAPPAARVWLREGGRASGGIEGVVMDGAGRPVAGALVALARARQPGELGPNRPAAMATSDGAGQFTFADAWTGSYQLTAAARGHLAARSRVFPLEAGKRVRVDLRLGAGGVSLSGQVLDEGGGAIPGAVVTAGLGYPWQASPGAERVDRQIAVIADDQGRYQLTLEPREYALRVRAGGYVPTETTVALTKPVTRDLRMAPAARISGRVVESAGGKPVPDAEVLLSGSPLDWMGHRYTRADAEGRFVIDDAGAGTFQVSARQRERNLFSAPRKLVTVATQSIDSVELKLAPGVRLAGTVKDAGGRVLAGVPVTIWSQDWESGMADRARVVSGADGGFSVALSGGGRFRVGAEAAGPGDPRGELTVAVGPQGLEGVELVLSAAPEPTSILGRVLGADGQPVAGALVRAEATGPPRGRPLDSAETETDGSFRLRSARSQRLTLVAWHPAAGFNEAEVQPGVSRPEVPQTIELRLTGGATIAGTVKFDDGTPAPGMSVAVTRQEGTVIYDSDTSGPDGRFAIRSLAPGRYTVQATRKRGPGNLWTSREEPHLKLLDVAAGEQKADLDLVVKRGGRSLAGSVRLPDGTPAVGAQLIANREERGRSWKPHGSQTEHRATADDDGHWHIGDVEDETYTVWAVLPGLPDAEANGVRAGRNDLPLVFPAPARVAGVVVGRDGRPISDFHLAALPLKQPNETAAQRERRAQVGRIPPARVQAADGAFSVEGLAAGPYELKVTTPEGGAGARETVTLAAGEQKSGLRLVVAAGIRATGKVVALENNKPMAGLSVFTRVGNRRMEAKTGVDGSYTLEGLMPGEDITVEVQPGMSGLDDRIGEYAEVAVPSGVASFDLGTFRLMAGNWRTRDRQGSLQMRVRLQDGRPVVGRLAADGPAAAAGIKMGEQILAVDGRDVSGLGPGAISFLMSKPVGSRVNLTLIIASGERRTVSVSPVKQ